MTVTVKERDDGVAINGYIFSQSEFEKIKTRIENNDFYAEFSQISSGLSVRRVDGEIALSKPDIFPKESWSFREWVEKSNGWKDYAKGTHDEWLAEFN